MKRLDITKLTYSLPPSAPSIPPWEAEEGEQFNIAEYLPARAAAMPNAKALIVPEGYNTLGVRNYSHLTFAQLDRLCDAYAHALVRSGFERGDRCLLMVKQGLELIAITFALFKIGAVPVLIDPGMGIPSFLACVRDCKPNAMVGIKLAFLMKTVKSSSFKSVKKIACTENLWWSSALDLSGKAEFDAGGFDVADTRRDELAAILFTSGSTGPPKGVHYTHGIFDAQTKAIQSMYNILPGEVAVPGFPLFALFSTAMGSVCVVPDMDPKAPAEVDPANIVEAIMDHAADMAFGSPAIWNAVLRYCEKENIVLESMTRLLTFGAPISPLMMERFKPVMPNGLIHTPYGATESLPVSTISSAEVLDETAEASKAGAGMCVGTPHETITTRIITITDDVIERWDDVEELPTGEIGELCVQGPQVTRVYDNKPEHTALAKIYETDDKEGPFWHRMGDIAYKDEQGRLWFCGRKSHRVRTADGTMFSVPCEAIVNNHPDVYRSALVGLGEPGSQVPAIVVEPEPGKFPGQGGKSEADFKAEVLKLTEANDKTKAIEHVLFHRSFPVDKRHNAKIHRLELRDWAAKQIN